NNSSTAGNAQISAGSSARLFFNDTSTAGNATINSGASGSAVVFSGMSSGGNATIIGGAVFSGNSTPRQALLRASGNSFDFTGTAGPGNDHKITAGSIEGFGGFFLGANQLTVGGNNLNTGVSVGGIADCGQFGPACTPATVGGSLVKIGT